ncbi:hypothetical protein GFS03_04335 [Sulfolobus sp. E5-1-F]|nr:hypothetical protein GFS03_04335 [Sulfolobus sp. E5-1-F]
MNKEQRERILKECLNRMRGISRVENIALTTIYSIVKRVGLRAFELLILRSQLKSLMAKSKVFEEFRTYLGMGRGGGLPDGIPFFESGYRDYKTFRFLSYLGVE